MIIRSEFLRLQVTLSGAAGFTNIRTLGPDTVQPKFRLQIIANSVYVFTQLCTTFFTKQKRKLQTRAHRPQMQLQRQPTQTFAAASQPQQTDTMAITFEVPATVHNGPQFARLRRSPSPHPRAISPAPKSGMKKALTRSRTVSRFLRGLDSSRMEPGEGYYQIGLRSGNDGTGTSKACSTENEDDDELSDSRIDMSEEEMMSMLHEKLWVVNGFVKDGGACARWKM